MTKEERAKENAELDCQKNRNKFCYSCANATERCFRNEIGCPCQKYKFWKEENDELKAQLERAKVYLKATSDLLQKQNESHCVLNILETTVFYDEADCDGYCLKDDIDTFLETGV